MSTQKSRYFTRRIRGNARIAKRLAIRDSPAAKPLSAANALDLSPPANAAKTKYKGCIFTSRQYPKPKPTRQLLEPEPQWFLLWIHNLLPVSQHSLPPRQPPKKPSAHNKSISSAIKPRDVDWVVFKNLLINAHLPTLYSNSPADIDQSATAISSNISEALSLAHKPATINITNKLPYEIRQLIKSKNRLRRLFQWTSNPVLKTEYNFLSDLVKQQIRELNGVTCGLQSWPQSLQ